jgi:hypothetical protein
MAFHGVFRHPSHRRCAEALIQSAGNDANQHRIVALNILVHFVDGSGGNEISCMAATTCGKDATTLEKCHILYSVVDPTTADTA